MSNFFARKFWCQVFGETKFWSGEFLTRQKVSTAKFLTSQHFKTSLNFSAKFFTSQYFSIEFFARDNSGVVTL